MAKPLTKNDIVGIFPPLATAFDNNEELDLSGQRAEVRYMLSLGVTGVCVGGSTGEGHALTAAELGTLTRTAVDEVAGRVPVMAGIITTSTREAVLKAKAAHDAGARAVMVTPPIYQIASDQGIADFYADIYREAGLPIVIYNVLPRTPVTPGLMRRIVAENPGVIGTKESIGGSLETLTELIESVGDKISVTWAHDWQLYPGLALGATGSISGAAAILPRHCISLWDALKRSDIGAAQRLHFQITGVCREISPYNWPAGVKLAINLQGRKVGPCRRPFNVVPADQQARIRAALKRVGALDLAAAA